MSSKTDELQSLTRDSDIYNETIKNKVINDEVYSSKIDELNFFNLNIDLYATVKWSNLSKKRNKENLSLSQYKKYVDMTPSERGSEFYCYSDAHDWTVSDRHMNTEYIISLFGKFTAPDGSEITGISKINISSQSDLQMISEIRHYKNNNKNVNINTIDDKKFSIDCDDKSYEFTYADSFNSTYLKNETLINEIVSYCKYDSVWSKAIIGELKYEDNKIYLPLLIDNEDEILFSFDHRETDSNLWNLAEEFDYSDPLMLEGEEVYIAFREYTGTKGIVKNQSWVVDIKPHNKIKRFYHNLIDYIFSILP